MVSFLEAIFFWKGSEFKENSLPESKQGLYVPKGWIDDTTGNSESQGNSKAGAQLSMDEAGGLFEVQKLSALGSWFCWGIF